MKLLNGSFIRIILILLIVSISLTLSSCGKKQEKELSRDEMQAKQGIPVEVVPVKKQDLLITIEASGELKADNAVVINTNNTGIIEQVLLKEGDYIKTNQIVAVIEPNDLQDQLSQAQANLNSAYMKLSQAQSRVILQRTQVEGAIKQAQAGVDVAEAKYNQTIASLKASKEQLSIIEEGSRTQDIFVAEEAVNQAEANLKEAEADLGRMKRLYEKGAIAKQQLDQNQLQYDVTKAQYNSSLHRLDLVKEGARKQEKEAAKQQVQIAEENVNAALASLSQAKESLQVAKDNRMQITVAQQEVDVNQALVQQAQANLATVSRKLEKSFVKSPISGYVTAKYVEPGENTSGPGATKIADVFDPRTLYFQATISETDIGKINMGLSVDVKIDGIPGKILKGYVKEIVPQASAGRQFTVKIAVDGKGTSDLKPGMFARGSILLAEHKGVLVLRKDTVREKDKKNFVYVLEELYAVEKPVVTGPSLDNTIEIAQGLKEGEKVILTGSVKNGDFVKVINEE